jgi:8-oxo-dGTP diphosphatase
LVREMREELGVEVAVGTRCFETHHNYGARDMHLVVYRCSLVTGEPRVIDVNAFEWVLPHQMLEREFLPADKPLVHGLAHGLVAE